MIYTGLDFHSGTGNKHDLKHLVKFMASTLKLYEYFKPFLWTRQGGERGERSQKLT